MCKLIISHWSTQVQGFLTWTQPCGMQWDGCRNWYSKPMSWVIIMCFPSHDKTLLHGKAFKFLAGLVLERVSKAPNFQQVMNWCGLLMFAYHELIVGFQGSCSYSSYILQNVSSWKQESTWGPGISEVVWMSLVIFMGNYRSPWTPPQYHPKNM